MRTRVQEAIEAAMEARWFASVKLDVADRWTDNPIENAAALQAALRAQLCLCEALMRLCRALADQAPPNVWLAGAAPPTQQLN